MTCNCHLHAYLELCHTFGKICPISLEHWTAILCVGHPEGLLVPADVIQNLRDITCNGITLCRSSPICQCIGQLNGLCASYIRTNAVFKDDNIGVNYFGSYPTTVSTYPLMELTINRHLHAGLELCNAFGKVCPISLEHPAAVLCVGHPEGLLVPADIADDLRNVACNGIKIY